MKTVRTKSIDATGIRVHTRHVSIAFHHWRHLSDSIGWTATVRLGGGAGAEFARGAGYVSEVFGRRIGGLTLYASHNAKGGLDQDKYVARPWRAGITDNANAVPYGFGA